MFQNNINGNKNKVKIEQNYKEEKNNHIIKEILVGLLVTVLGGIILYFIIGD